MARRVLAVAALLPGVLACNEYRFNPMGHCLLQPGSVQVPLSNTSSADILFVVDDSPSMDPKQAGLAASFTDFIQRVVEANVARTSKGLQPIDFQIGVTTSSVFSAGRSATSCVASTGGPLCCAVSACTDVTSCTRGTSDGCGGGQVCVTDEMLDPNGIYVVGTRSQCCTPSGCAPSSGCALGDRCPVMTTRYPNPFPSSSFCTPGLATAGAPYPAGNLVSAGSNPKVLTFGKQLDWASWGTATPDPALVRLVNQFQENIRVGSCGSGEEQHLEAARLAIWKAVTGQQPDLGGATFPRAGAKLVVVWVGDEDDCSSPPSAPLVMGVHATGADACSLDKHRPAGDRRAIPASDYADFLTSLVNPYGAADLGAAFIVSAARCSDGSYAPADACVGSPWCPVSPPASCSPPAGVCSGAYAAGERFFALADAIRARGFKVVEGTVCDAYPPSTFGPVLSAIADILPPPSMLKLPTLPAAGSITTVRITDSSGQTLKTCAQGTDWCFVESAACVDGEAASACLPTGTSQCIAIDHGSGGCEADAGQIYSAEYIGRLPADGCATTADCVAALGGSTSDWICSIEAGQSRGSCTCTGR